ncbi:GNAT family N-acetyltransferase [Arenimonas sp.]|uniref:GNAT family N-acetyltransferase n=1 Tax=Arenimonas sp. TaxID=1872635 RepID=UPI0039E6E1D4
MTMPTGYSIRRAIPSEADYRRLREQAGMSPKTAAAAARGLPNSQFAVQIVHEGETIGMGRVIGDGGCFYQVVDIAVLPAHQGRGLGKAIMAEISSWIETDVPESAYVSLIADGQAHALYAQYGFSPTAPRSIGMAMVKRART